MAKILKLASLDPKLVNYKGSDFLRCAADNTADYVIGSGEDKLSRDEIVATGRACAAEYLHRCMSGKKSENNKVLGADYNTLSAAHSRKKLLFCAAMAYAAIGKAAPQSVEQVKADNSLYKDPIFLRALSAIDTEVVSPMLYDVFTDLGGSMLKMDRIPLGRTKEVNINSNDVFLWEDTAWGSSHSTTKNYLYPDTVTMNPRPFTSNGTIKWFQMIAADEGMDAGWYYAAIIRGMWSKITALYTGALTDAASIARYVPQYLRFDSYSSANWAAATQAVAVANGVRRENLMAFGEYSALQAVLPNGTPSDAALTYQLGEEWMKNGFVSMVGRVPLYEVLPALVPGTVNTTGQMFGLGDNIYITARVGDDLAPVYAAIAEGSPITIEYSPSVTANFVIDINMTALMDVKAIFAGRLAVIQNVVMPTT